MGKEQSRGAAAVLSLNTGCAAPNPRSRATTSTLKASFAKHSFENTQVLQNRCERPNHTADTDEV